MSDLLEWFCCTGGTSDVRRSQLGRNSDQRFGIPDENRTSQSRGNSHFPWTWKTDTCCKISIRQSCSDQISNELIMLSKILLIDSDAAKVFWKFSKAFRSHAVILRFTMRMAQRQTKSSEQQMRKQLILEPAADIDSLKYQKLLLWYDKAHSATIFLPLNQ